MRKFALRCFIAACTLCAAASTARAVYLMTLQEVGADVVIQGSGSLNTNALTFSNAAGTPPFELFPFDGFVLAGFGNATIYSGISGPAMSFGPGGPATATSTTGDIVGVRASGSQALIIPDGYVSNTAFASTATFADTTLDNLGFTPDSYVFTWGTGADADSLTITSAVPEPTATAFLSVGLAAVAMALWRRRAAARPTAE